MLYPVIHSPLTATPPISLGRSKELFYVEHGLSRDGGTLIGPRCF